MSSSSAAVTSSPATGTPATQGTLDQFVANATLRPPTHGLRQLGDAMRRSDDVLYAHLPNLEQLLSLLNPQEHSVPIAQVLCVRLSSLPVDADWDRVGPICAQTCEFMRVANYSHIGNQHTLDIWTRLVKTFTSCLISRNKPIMAIQPLVHAISQLRNDGELLAFMSQFLRLCIMAKCFKPALTVLENDIVEIRKEAAVKFDVADALLYYYYGGVIYLAIKDYSRAHLFFEVTVSFPATAVSKIMVEAYKKWLLISFLLGKGSELKMNNTFTRSVKQSTQPYVDLCSCQGDTDELATLQARCHDIFNDDGNLGLVKQCVKAQFKRNIHRLTKTFLTLSLGDIATSVKLSSPTLAEEYLVEMIEEGAIMARIDDSHEGHAMVSFLDDGGIASRVDGTRLLTNLSTQVERCERITSRIKGLDDSIRTNPGYVKRVAQATNDDEAIWKLGPGSAL